jgi:hypothetical protein
VSFLVSPFVSIRLKRLPGVVKVSKVPTGTSILAVCSVPSSSVIKATMLIFVGSVMIVSETTSNFKVLSDVVSNSTSLEFTIVVSYHHLIES